MGSGREYLVSIAVTPKRPAHYEPRFDFHAEAQRITEAEFGAALDCAWQQALATAR